MFVVDATDTFFEGIKAWGEHDGRAFHSVIVRRQKLF